MAVLACTFAREPAHADEPTAAEVEHAPPPGKESGRTDTPATDSFLRNVGRALLTPPRIALEIAFTPVRLGAYLSDRYQLPEQFRRLFFDDSYTYGAYPTLVVDSSYGATLGARVVHRNLLGKREKLAVRVGVGGEYRGRVDGSVGTGDHLGRHVRLDVGGEYEQRPADAFYGIGNAVDAVEARHRQQIARTRLTLDVHAVSDLHVRASTAFTDLEYGRSDKGQPIDELYSPMTLTGWTSGMSNAYGELELRWDSRRLPDLDTHGSFAGGTLATLYGGRVHQLEDMGRDYWGYGAEVQYFTQLGSAPRAIMMRVRTDAVTGEREDIAFTQLPQLGGSQLLRGYPRDRFRDRMSLVTTAEYTWDLSRWLMASTFVDVGRVYPGWTELHYEKLRVGYGMSLQLHMSRRFLGALQVATSIDGGVFVDFTFDPAFDTEPRVEQQ